jgi:nucleoside-diphosphate-sugar epimerase
MSSHSVYDVSKNSSHSESLLLESDAVRPGREISPLDRYKLKGKNKAGDAALECEEELVRQYNAGGFPFVIFRLTNVIGPKENTIRYWLLHLWILGHIDLRLPMQLDESILDEKITFTYTLDIARATVKAISKARNETCCTADVEGEAFNIASEEAPNQKTLYELIGEPIGMPYVETQERNHSSAIVLYPDILRGPVSIEKASDKLGWAPTDLRKALRSVARFYDRTMIDEGKYKYERSIMYHKMKHMLSEDGPRFASWIRRYYDERRKEVLYDELDDADEDEIVMVRADPSERKKRRKRRRQSSGSEL